MTTQERIEALEQTSRTHDAMLNLLISIGERQQDTADEHKGMLERQQGLAERQQAMLERQDVMVERQQALLEEVRRDSAQTQRLWVRLAERHGWLEDDDLFGKADGADQ